MPHMHLANRLRSVGMLLCHALIATSVWQVLPLHSAEPTVIDFTKPAIEQSDLLSAPGFLSGTATYVPPIKVIIRSITRVGEADSCRIELLLSNTGQSDFQLPISRHSARVLRAGT